MFSDFVPCISAVSILLVIFGFLAFLRYMTYKETLALAEKGLTKPSLNLAKVYYAGGFS